MNKIIVKCLSSLLLVVVATFADAEEKVTVFAAASLTNALGEISAQYEKANPVKVVHSFASSSTLAKQIEAGAPADIFISADAKWMNYLQDKKLIDTPSRKDLLGNKLVLIVPKGKSFNVQFDKSFDFAKAFDGRLCTGDVDSVPAGIYAKQSLTYLNWWDGIKTRIVGAQDVRGALAFVERGECGVGIVYETDAKVSSKVDIIGIFPEASHLPIIYPIAFVANAKNINKEYFNYLQGPEGLAIFTKYGFSIIGKQ
ncbi:MAG TPA: molybdate ABC transporter substrate-binding protein [Methylophilaceae bacterium]|nr:molybdate ABC transporter substrate-binding protein [Methylophilaceae bacterium]